MYDRSVFGYVRCLKTVISGLGSKKNPLHVLVEHGTLRVRSAPALEYHQIRSWFQGSDVGRVEGIVWHCDDGALVKVTSCRFYSDSSRGWRWNDWF